MRRFTVSVLALGTVLSLPAIAQDAQPRTDASAGATAAQDAGPVEVPSPSLALPAEAPKIDSAEAPKPPAPAAFQLAEEIQDRLKRERVTGADREDRDEAAKVYDTRAGAPLWVTEAGLTAKALALMGEIRNADNYGLVASAFRLPEPPAAGTSRAALADADVTLTLAALKYARHARGGRLDPISLNKNLDRKPVLFAPATILAELATAPNPDSYLRSFHPRHPQFERLRLKYVAVRAGQTVLDQPAPAPAAAAEQPAGKGKAAKSAPPAPRTLTNAQLERKLLANLEMWRWMPLELGDYYIQNNIPEFTTRMVRGGKTVHLERIVTGKVENQTPVFSDEMEHLVFKPFWNVPTSIKWKELQPQLMRNPDALSRAGLRAAYNGREVNPATIDWSTADMRAFHVFQPPGSANALGQVKFMFPNKHDVYMHDTPHKALFNNPARAYSHGCMRVRDPLKFAELLLSHDKGWTMQQVVQAANNGPDNNEIKLTRKIPVHVTYFTTWVDEDGKLKVFNDIYGHETRVHLGLEGKAHLIVNPREEKYVPPSRGGPAFVQKSPWWGGSSGSSDANWMKNVFNF